MLVEEFSVVALGLKICGKAWKSRASVTPENAKTKILALHGSLDNCATFDRLMPFLFSSDSSSSGSGSGSTSASLLSEDCFAFCCDLPGHGFSDHMHPTATYKTIDLVNVVYNVVDALKWDRFHVIGHSLGGTMALLLAGLIPQRILSTVVIDSLGIWPRTDLEIYNEYAQSFEQFKILTGKREKPKIYKDFDAALAQARKSNWEWYRAMREEDLRVLLGRGTKVLEDGKSVVYRHDAKFNAFDNIRYHTDHFMHIIRHISCPVLLILCTNGIGARYFGFDDVKVESLSPQQLDLKERYKKVAHLMEEFPGYHLRVKGSHHVQLEDPELISPFVKSLLINPRNPSFDESLLNSDKVQLIKGVIHPPMPHANL